MQWKLLTRSVVDGVDECSTTELGFVDQKNIQHHLRLKLQVGAGDASVATPPTSVEAAGPCLHFSCSMVGLSIFTLGQAGQGQGYGEQLSGRCQGLTNLRLIIYRVLGCEFSNKHIHLAVYFSLHLVVQTFSYKTPAYLHVSGAQCGAFPTGSVCAKPTGQQGLGVVAFVSGTATTCAQSGS